MNEEWNERWLSMYNRSCELDTDEKIAQERLKKLSTKKLVFLIASSSPTPSRLWLKIELSSPPSIVLCKSRFFRPATNWPQKRDIIFK